MEQYIDRRETDFLRNTMVFNYCLGNEKKLLLESYIHNNHLDICFNPNCYYFFMTGPHRKFFDNYTPATIRADADRIYLMFDTMKEALIKHGYNGNVFQIKEDNSKQTGIIFSAVKESAVSLSDIISKLYDIHHKYNIRLECSSTSFVGPYSGYKQLHQAFCDARELNDLLFFGVRDIVITKEYREKTARPCDVTAILGNVRRLITTICTGTQAQALKQADYIIREMIAPSYAMDNFTALFTSFDDLLGMMEIVYPENIRIARRAQESFFTLEDYHAWLRESIAAIFAQLKDIPRYSPTILMALSCINRNYMRDLSLTQLSEYVYANASVLSSQFNDEVGMSLSEYVTGLRIKKAQELLRDTDMTVPAIAEQVGFTSAKYFREIFKKTTGLSPQGYRDWRSE